MNKILKKIVSVFVGLSLMLGNVVFAESTPAFTYDFTSTTNTEYFDWKFKIKAGETVQDSFVVKNLDTERTIELKPQANEMEPSPYINPIWINLPGIITLAPLESKTVPFSVTIPAGTLPQKYQGSLKVILTNYFGVTGGNVQVFVAIGKMLSIEVLAPEPEPLPIPAVTLTGKSYKHPSTKKTGVFLDWEDLPQLGTGFDKYNIKFKKGYYENFTTEKTANSYVSYGSYYDFVSLQLGYMWTFQVVPVRKIDGKYLEVSDKSNIVHCKITDKQISEAFVCSYLTPAEAAAIGVKP